MNRALLSLAMCLVGVIAASYPAVVVAEELAADADGGVGEEPSPAADGGEDEYTEPSDRRGLLASPGFDLEPVKGLYFFPGEAAASNEDLYTAHPSVEEDQHWNSDPSTRESVIARMIATHANTLIMSYWGDDMPQWSPMELDDTSVSGVIDAVQGEALVVLPALESGFDKSRPSTPHWRFSEDFPYADGVYDPEQLAPSFLARLHAMTALFKERRGAWAQLYDRRGRPRFAVQVLQVYAQRVPEVAGKTPDQVMAAAFDAAAREVYAADGVEIGFTLDLSVGDPGTHGFVPSRSGSALERAESILALQFFMSETASGRALVSKPRDPPVDNNQGNLGALIDGQLGLLESWRRTGLPVIYDVSSGFDGRFVWASLGTNFWGDNFNYTSDAWRNLESENKSENFIGISFNTWNGFTEGYAAVPTVEHGSTIYDWLTDMFEPDPRECSHVEYENGRASHRVSGVICEKWRELGGRRGVLGPPIGDESSREWGRFTHFAGGSVFATGAFGVREVHGAIHTEYARLGYESSCLGLPISDEEEIQSGRVSRFEHGVITFREQDAQVRASCSEPQ